MYLLLSWLLLMRLCFLVYFPLVWDWDFSVKFLIWTANRFSTYIRLVSCSFLFSVFIVFGIFVWSSGTNTSSYGNWSDVLLFEAKFNCFSGFSPVPINIVFSSLCSYAVVTIIVGKTRYRLWRSAFCVWLIIQLLCSLADLCEVRFMIGASLFLTLLKMTQRNISVGFCVTLVVTVFVFGVPSLHWRCLWMVSATYQLVTLFFVICIFCPCWVFLLLCSCFSESERVRFIFCCSLLVTGLPNCTFFVSFNRVFGLLRVCHFDCKFAVIVLFFEPLENECRSL